MKKTHLVGIIVIAIAIVALSFIMGDVKTYVSFDEAMHKPDRKVQVVGYLSKNKPMEYNPEVDPNYFTFYMKDKQNGKELKVVYLDSKPQDFERSEEVVVTGKIKDGQFVATDMLMKCPSKYVEEEIGLKDKVYN